MAGRGKVKTKQVGIVIPAAALKRQLALRGWSQADLARAAGVAEKTVSKAATGQAVAPRIVLKLGNALKRNPVNAGLAELLSA